MDIQELAQAFAAGKTQGNCHNARIDENGYWLHNTLIAHRGGYSILGNWGGHWTKTTASHLNAIITAFEGQMKVCERVSYAKARDNGVNCFTLATS